MIHLDMDEIEEMQKYETQDDWLRSRSMWWWMKALLPEWVKVLIRPEVVGSEWLTQDEKDEINEAFRQEHERTHRGE